MDIIGYAFDADTYCVECTEKRYPGIGDWRRDGYDPSDYTDSEGNEVTPMFEYDESDTPSHCSDCGAFLGNALTSDGYAYVIEALSEATGVRSVLREWLDRYSDGFEDEDWAELGKAWADRMLADRKDG